MEKELLNRNLYRQIKSMDKNELSRTLNNIYKMGKEDAMKGIEAIDPDMDRLRSQIGAVKGIGETRLNLIMEIISCGVQQRQIPKLSVIGNMPHSTMG